MFMTGFRTASLVAATVSMGLAAGTFDLYAHTIMPGLKKTDDRTFVGAFQSIDRAIINPWFIGATFLGALALTAAAGIANWKQPGFGWIVGAFAAYVVVVAITITVNVSLNDAIKAAGDPATIDAASVRANFHEARWAAWNLVRAVASTGAFVSQVWALVIHGRSTS
jgi:uncharacterized membrane protein